MRDAGKICIAGILGGSVIVVAVCGAVYFAPNRLLPLPTPPKPDPIVELDQVCHLKHLRFQVFCTDYTQNPNHQFQADAEHAAEPETAIYVEDGALPFWAGTGPTESAAVESLLDSIALHTEGPLKPDHSPEYAAHHCKTIEGGEIAPTEVPSAPGVVR